VPLAVLSRQTIISRQLRALSTRARLAESPERAETAVSAQEDQACDAAATTPPVKSMRRALVHSCLGNNRLVASSSPPSPTTQSCTNGDFPVQCESPRTAQTEISQFNANRPELAAICARILSLQSAGWIAGTVLRSLSLPWKIAFPDGGSWPW